MTNNPENSGMRYRIDASRSSFTAQAFAEGMLSFMGHNPTFAVGRYGSEIQLDSSNSQVDSMLLKAQASELSLLDKVSAKDSAEIENTMRQEVLEISRYPEIVFVSRDVSMRQIAETRYAVQINGFLSLHGETRGQSINTEAEISGKTIRAQGEFKLKQSDFNIKKVKALGGTLKVKDEVEISFDITAEIQKFNRIDLPFLKICTKLSIALSIVEMATEESNKRGGAKVDAIHLKLGRLSGVVKDALLFSWEIACQGTTLENSRLEITEIPVRVHCEICKTDQTLAEINNFSCPVCNAPTPEVRQGRELEVTALEIIE